MRARRAAWAGAMLLGAAGAAGAAGPDTAEADLARLERLLEVPVYGASKYAQTAAEAPASVTVLAAGDIASFGWRTLAEVLDGVRGVHLRRDGGYDYLGVRGLSRPGDYSSRVLLLIDGVRVNDNLYDSAMPGREFPLDVALIERVEFIAGPGSALYGPNAVFGVVNVITRSTSSLRGERLALTGGSERERKLLFTSGRELEGGDLLVGIGAELRPGRPTRHPEHASPANPEGLAHTPDAERDAKAYLRHRLGDWTWTGMVSSRSKQVGGAPFGYRFDDPAAVWRDRMAMLDARWERRLDADHGVYLHAGLARYVYADIARYDDTGALSTFRNDGRWIRLEGRWITTAWAGHRLVLGADVQRNLRQSLRIATLEPVAVTDADVTQRSTRHGVFVQDEYTPVPGLRLGAGLRADRQTRGGAQVTPRASIIWEPAPGLFLKALAGQAYREPNFSERQPTDMSMQVNPDLRHETFTSRELALDWRAGPRLRLASSLYDHRIAGMIEQREGEDGGLVFRNVGQGRTRGLELEADWTGPGGWRVRASWALQRVTVAGQASVSNAPSHLAKLHATTAVPGWPVRLGLEMQGMGPRLTLAGQRLPGHVLAHLTARIEPPGARWSLAATVRDLGDVARRDPAGPEFVQDSLPTRGRGATLQLALQF